MRVYECSVWDKYFSEEIVAENAGKARYQYFIDLTECYPDAKITEIKVKSLGKFKPIVPPNQIEVDRWNNLYQVGQKVRFWTSTKEGVGRLSQTRTPARIMPSGCAVVWLKGLSGCISLSHVEAVEDNV